MGDTLFRALYPVLAGLVLAWGVAAVLHTEDMARAGFSISRGQRVVHVVPGSPAERAGLRAGDSILRIDGVETRDRAAVARLSLGPIGASRRLEVRRGDATLTFELRLAGLTSRERWRRYAGILGGVLFLIPTGLAWIRRPGRTTATLALMGLGVGLAFMGQAGLTPGTWATLAQLIRNGLILAGVGAGVQFLRLMTAPPGAGGRNGAAVYVPLAAYWLLLTARTLNAEDTPALVRSFASFTGGLLFGVYLALAAVILARAWVRSRQGGPAPRGLRLLCLGPLLGLAPVALASLGPVLWPAMPLPGADFWFLAVVLVPMSWSVAAVTCDD